MSTRNATNKPSKKLSQDESFGLVLLSMRLSLNRRVEVYMHDRSSPVLSQSDPGKSAHATPLYGRQLTDAEARINAIIHVNSGTIATLHQTHS